MSEQQESWRIYVCEGCGAWGDTEALDRFGSHLVFHSALTDKCTDAPQKITVVPHAALAAANKRVAELEDALEAIAQLRCSNGTSGDANWPSEPCPSCRAREVLAQEPRQQGGRIMKPVTKEETVDGVAFNAVRKQMPCRKCRGSGILSASFASQVCPRCQGSGKGERLIPEVASFTVNPQDYPADPESTRALKEIAIAAYGQMAEELKSLELVRLCIESHHPIDPGNYKGPIHCTAHPQGTACVTALYRRMPAHQPREEEAK